MFVSVAILICLISYVLWTRRHIYKLSWELPGPFSIPLIGNILSAHPNYLLSYLDQLSKTYGLSPIRIWFGPIMIVFIADAENVDILLKSKDCLSKPYLIYKNIRDGLNVDGLFTLQAKKWKVHRRLVGPTLNQHSVGMHLPDFNENVRKILPELPVNGEFFDILPYITRCKMTMFLEAALGSDWDPGVKQRYLKQLLHGIELVVKRTMEPLYNIDFIWNMTESAKQLKEYHLYGHNLFEKILKQKSENEDNSDTIVGRLIDVSKKNPIFTMEDVLAETATIMSGATDTSSIASAFTVLLLALYPEYQETAFQEVYKVMPDKNADLTQTDLEKLTFIDLCVRETLRIFPTAPLIGRVTEKPVALNNNVVIPVGIPIFFGLRQIHLQEKYYGKTANTFNPYRFLDEDIKNLPSSAFCAFSYGPRNCIGYHYAQASVKCFVAHMIRNYRLTTSYTDINQLHIVENISMKLLGNHMVKIEPRNI